jgi:hypothetical protein
VILLRSTDFDERVARFARALQAASGDRVCFVVDERNGPIPIAGFDKIGLSAPAIARLQVYAPQDFAWRCGDYGFYLARRRYPDEAHFWMIEHDVRVAGDAARFFKLVAGRPDLDFVGTDLRPAERLWYWTRAISSRDATPYRCLFPITRLTARAIDALLAKRRRHSSQLRRKLFWPNDESFVATTMLASGFEVADFKALEPSLYDQSTFKYHGVFDEAGIIADGGRPILYHPVLSGEALARKLARLAMDERDSPLGERVTAKLASVVNRRFAW